MKFKKQIIIGFMAAFACLWTVAAQDYAIERVEKNMLLPDGATADMAFFKKWGDAGKYAKATDPTAGMKTMISTKIVKAKTETDLGLFQKWYAETENESVAKIAEVMKESGSTYGIAWIPHDKWIRRGVFTYKKGKVRYDFLDFFDESHEVYAAWKAGEDAKQKRREDFAGSLVDSAFRPLTEGASSASNETPEQTLYRLRHHTYTYSMMRAHGTPINFNYRYIYYDNGNRVPNYIVDLNGNIRSEVGLVSTDIDKTFPLVEYYSVPKEIRALAQKSLD